MNYSIGSSECYISVSQLRNWNKIKVCLYILDNKQIYESLLLQKEDIEHVAGIALIWCGLPERKASKIMIERAADLCNHSEWNEQFNWLIDVMVKMKNAFKKYQ